MDFKVSFLCGNSFWIPFVETASYGKLFRNTFNLQTKASPDLKVTSYEKQAGLLHIFVVFCTEKLSQNICRKQK